MKLSLVVQTPGHNQGKVLEIKLSQFVVGRDPHCHLRPSSLKISKRHCAVLQRDNKVFVRDLESINGTFVNDEQVNGELELHDGDRLRMGPLLFEVKIEVATSVNRPEVSRKPATQPAATANTPASSVDKKASSQRADARKPARAASAVASDTQTDAPAAQAETSAEGGGTSSDEDIAAMLLSLRDDSSDRPFDGGSEVPDGSTIHEKPPPTDLAAQLAPEREKAKHVASGNTAQAAKNILAKYMKQPRAQ